MKNQLMKREEGISALEYILIALVIALVIVIGAAALGTSMNTQFDNASSKVDNP
jgi:pilus assembly protein Flp/PilA